MDEMPKMLIHFGCASISSEMLKLLYLKMEHFELYLLLTVKVYDSNVSNITKIAIRL